MADNSDPSTLNKIFGHVAHKLNYSKVDTIGINNTGVLLTSWEKALKIYRSWEHTNQMAHN
jgi:hypothetical protein